MAIWLINFISEFMVKEKGATRAQAIKEWKKLKTMEIEKDYKSWKQNRGAGLRNFIKTFCRLLLLTYFYGKAKRMLSICRQHYKKTGNL